MYCYFGFIEIKYIFLALFTLILHDTFILTMSPCPASVIDDGPAFGRVTCCTVVNKSRIERYIRAILC